MSQEDSNVFDGTDRRLELPLNDMEKTCRRLGLGTEVLHAYWISRWG